MKVTKLNEDVYLFQNDKGEYHLSVDKYNELGEAKAIEFAKAEIDKKLKSTYQDVDIDFARARELGFCEYGIKDFCERLGLNPKNTYKISYLKRKLTAEVFIEYVGECSKLFGKDSLIKKFGGIKNMLSENRSRKMLDFVFYSGFISDKKLHLLACDFAEKTLSVFEKEHPDDKRPRNAIETKKLWIQEEYKNEQI
jgi:hypothetical protein